MGLLDKVYNPIAKATANYLYQQAEAKLQKSNDLTSPAVGPMIRRSAVDANVLDPSLRRKPQSSVSFETLRRFAITHEVSRICINARKRQISSLDWEITALDPEDKTDYTTAKEELYAYFKNLGGYRMRFRELQDILIEDVLTLDAACLYKQKDRVGNILYYMPVDASTIKLRVDDQGNTPMPPEPAYVQYIRGTKRGEYTADEMIYEMMNPRSDTPYGLAPLESLILIVTSSLKGTLYNLDYLTAGNVPEGFMKLPESWSVKQIEEYMTLFDAMMSGDSQQTTKVKAAPGDFTPTKKRDDMAFKDFNNWLMQLTCAMFDIQPQEIGFTMDVNRSNGGEQNNITTRKGILPLSNMLKEVWDDIIQVDLGYPQLQFKYLGLEDRDQVVEATANQIRLNSGVITIDEVRKEEGLDPIGGQASMPYITGMPTFLNTEVIAEDEIASTQGKDAISTTEAHDTETAESGDSKLMPGGTKSVDAELKKFKRATLKRLSEGKKVKAFGSDIIPIDALEQINKHLATVGTKEEATHFFDKVGPRFLAKRISDEIQP